MQKLLDQLDSIFEVLGKDKVSSPIESEDLRGLLVRLPFSLPSDVENIYRWHNGIEEIIPCYDFLCLSDAISLYEELILLGEELQSENLFNKNHFPLFRFDDSYIFVDCALENQSNIYELWLEGGEAAVKKYKSLEKMFQVIVEAYLSRAYYMDGDSVVQNSVLLQKIKSKYYSQETKNERKLNWDNLCSEFYELMHKDASRKKVAANIWLPDQSESFDLAEIAAWKKENLISGLIATYDERAIDMLVEFLSDDNPEIVAKAAFGLGELRAREKLPELIKLTTRHSGVVRNLATHAIAEIISPEDKLLVQPLLKLLADKEKLVRMSAIEALGQLRSSTAVQPLIDVIQDQQSGLRWPALEALGKIGDASAVKFIQKERNQGTA
jgi:HEAT repeats